MGEGQERSIPCRGTAADYGLLKESRPSLISQLYEKRRRLEEQMSEIDRSIRILEGNGLLTDLIQTVLGVKRLL